MVDGTFISSRNTVTDGSCYKQVRSYANRPLSAVASCVFIRYLRKQYLPSLTNIDQLYSHIMKYTSIFLPVCLEGCVSVPVD